VLPQGFSNQCGTIPLRPACGLIRGLQKLFIENNLDCFHMSTLFHNIPHNFAHNQPRIGADERGSGAKTVAVTSFE
jgi:hypothetical protein